MACEKKNPSLHFSTTGKCQPSGPSFQWETRQASFSTGTLDPRVGIFLSSTNINDGFYLSTFNASPNINDGFYLSTYNTSLLG